MAAEEWGRLKGESPRRIDIDICLDKSKGSFKFEDVDSVVQHRLPSEIIAELDAIKQARIPFAPWAAMAAATATFVEPEPMYRFEEVLFDAEFESALQKLSGDIDETFSSPTSGLMGTVTPSTEISENEGEGEDKGTPPSGGHEMPVGLGLAIPCTEQVLELSTVIETCVERDAEPAGPSAVGLGIALTEDAHARNKKKFHHSTDAEACTVLGAASSSTFAPRAPRFNAFVFEDYAVPEAVPSDRSTTAPPAPQPNTFGFEQSPAGHVLLQSPGPSPSSPHTAASVSSSSGLDEYMRRAAVNRISRTAESGAPTVWNFARGFFSGYSAAAPRKDSFNVNFVEAFENGGFGA